LALALSSGLPILVLVFVIQTSLEPAVDPRDTTRLVGLHSLAFFTLLATVAGASVIWDLGRAVSRLGERLENHRASSGLETRGDEVAMLVSSFSRMLDTIERQAQEINNFAVRLDGAYKELEFTNTRLKETSFKDDVTGLYNRRFFSLRLEEEMSRYRRFNHPVAVVLLDLDGFKAVNDEFGHAVGDETLRDVGRILVKHSRGINVVSRYGGDEFAILLVETSKAGAHLYAERIRHVVASYPFSHGKLITASFGVASLPDDEAASGDDLFRAADEALYGAKRAGKNQVVGAGPQNAVASSATVTVPRR
jgi:diguanylate cyclase (GGDEF)-like protein